MGNSHGVKDVIVDDMDSAEPPTEDPLPTDLISTRNKLLRVKRRLADIKTQLLASRQRDPDAEAVPAAEKPASFFVGVDVEVDLARIADELASNAEDLARLI